MLMARVRYILIAAARDGRSLVERLGARVFGKLRAYRRSLWPALSRWKHLLILSFVLLPVLLNLIVVVTTRDQIFDTSGGTPERHAAVVLGAKVYRNGRPSPVLADRLEAALTLYREHKVRKILVTGDHGSPSYNEVTAMSRWLRERGVPPRDIFLDHAGFRTFDSMARAAAVFGVKDAVVCTQAFHLPRAVFLANAFGIDAVGLVSDRRSYHHHYLNHGREICARAVAVLDAYVWHASPKYLGEPFAITGDGRRTR
jgi:SanA protein